MDIAQIDPEGTASGKNPKGEAFSDPARFADSGMQDKSARREGTAIGKSPKGKAFSERRGCRRCDMDIPVRFVLVSVPEGNIIEEGSARARNISPSGIEVSDIEIPSHSLPLKPFQITLFIEQWDLERIHMLCSVRWISTNGTISLGLHIDRMPEKHRFRLNEFIRELKV